MDECSIEFQPRDTEVRLDLAVWRVWIALGKSFCKEGLNVQNRYAYCQAENGELRIFEAKRTEDYMVLHEARARCPAHDSASTLFEAWRTLVWGWAIYTP